MNVLVCGVGGQGVLLFSGLLAQVAMDAGLNVKKSEVHGMAQRGGSVTSHIRFGPQIHAPLIDPGAADLLVAFERLEALRYAHFVCPREHLLYDPQRIDPVPVLIGTTERPSDAHLDERIRAHVAQSQPVPAAAVARELGNARVQNVVMLGAVSRFLDFPAENFHQAIRSMVKERFVELNLAAFDTGRTLVNGG